MKCYLIEQPMAGDAFAHFYTPAGGCDNLSVANWKCLSRIKVTDESDTKTERRIGEVGIAVKETRLGSLHLPRWFQTIFWNSGNPSKHKAFQRINGSWKSGLYFEAIQGDLRTLLVLSFLCTQCICKMSHFATNQNIKNLSRSECKQ